MYIEQIDLEEGIFPEVLKAVSRKPENITTAITEAMSEVESYLSARYKIAEEFRKTGDNRNTLVKKFVREIAIYNCYNISNPSTMPESKVTRYKSIITMLKDIQTEKASINGLDLIASSSGKGSNFVRFGGNKKRKNSY